MQRLVREPLLHFAALGLLLLAGRALIAPAIGAMTSPGTVHVTAADVDRLRAQWRQKTGHAADDEELRGLIRDYVDDQLLFQEAKRLDLQHSDPVVRRRLIRNLRFADPDTDADDDALLKAAYAMGMVDRDPVVRRRLIERMRQRIESTARVSEDQVTTYLAAHRADLSLAKRYRFRQLFFSRDERGARARQAAVQALSRLRGAHPPAIGRMGDPFQLGQRFTAVTRDDIERRFGAAFAARVVQAPVGRWVGPVSSVYGMHLIRVDAVRDGGQAPEAAVRPRAVARLYRTQERARLQAALARLRDRYRIVIDAPMPSAEASS